MQPRLQAVGLLSVIAVAFVLVGAVMVWARRAFETVDLADVDARRRAAAAWMASGEADEAERMLRAAIELLTDWPQALARGDLASLLIAMGRDPEALEELALACQGTAPPQQQAEMLELRIRLAHLLVQAERVDEAERVLLDSAAGTDSLGGALAAEALAEFYVGQHQHLQALELLRPALSLLSSKAHDRAASAVVTLAYALQGSGEPELWQALGDMPVDLQGAAVVNFCDRLPRFVPSSARQMLDALLKRLEGKTSWDWECEQLHRAAKQLEPEP